MVIIFLLGQLLSEQGHTFASENQSLMHYDTC